MKVFIGLGFSFLLFFISWQPVFANPIFHSAGFHHIFNGTDYRGPGGHLHNTRSVLSGDGKVVVLLELGTGTRGIFIQDFDSQGQAQEVVIPAEIGDIMPNVGMVSNHDGSRVFFVAATADVNDNDRVYCMLNAKTGAISILRRFHRTDVEDPVHIGTDAAGNFLYFNESDNGDQGDLWRIDANNPGLSVPPERVIDNYIIPHPSGGLARFIGEFDVSDDGGIIAFFVDGNINGDGSLISRYDRELFVKTAGGISNLTHDNQNAKTGVRISGDGSTILYRGNNVHKDAWMLTPPTGGVNAAIRIEENYHSCGPRPEITQDGSRFFARSAKDGFGSCDAYLVNTDGSGRRMVDPSPATGVAARTSDFGLSADGTRVLFGYTEGQGSSIFGGQMYTGVLYPDEPHLNLWPDEVPEVDYVDYPSPLATRLDQPFPQFQVEIGVSDPKNVAAVNVVNSLYFANSRPDPVGSIIRFMFSPVEQSPGIWTINGGPATGWASLPNKLDPEIARFSVLNPDGDVAYADVIMQAAEADCSGDGDQLLVPAVVVRGKDVSCITSGRISVDPGVTIRDGVMLYLSGAGVGFTWDFHVAGGGKLGIVVQ